MSNSKQEVCLHPAVIHRAGDLFVAYAKRLLGDHEVGWKCCKDDHIAAVLLLRAAKWEAASIALVGFIESAERRDYRLSNFKIGDLFRDWSAYKDYGSPTWMACAERRSFAAQMLLDRRWNNSFRGEAPMEAPLFTILRDCQQQRLELAAELGLPPRLASFDWPVAELSAFLRQQAVTWLAGRRFRLTPGPFDWDAALPDPAAHFVGESAERTSIVPTGPAGDPIRSGWKAILQSLDGLVGKRLSVRDAARKLREAGFSWSKGHPEMRESELADFADRLRQPAESSGKA